MHQSVQSSPPGAANSKEDAAELRNRVFQWVESAAPILNSSSWGRYLFLQGISVVDATIEPLNLRMLALFRQVGAAAGNRVVVGPTMLEKARRFVARPHVPERWLGYLATRTASALSDRPRACPVVFLPGHPTHVQQQVPVAKVLPELGVPSLFLTSHPEIFRLLRRQGLQSLFSRGVWGRALRDARQRGRRVAVSLQADAEVPSLPVCEGHATTSVAEAVKDVLVSALPAVHEAVAMVEEVHREIEPSMIVPGNVVILEGRVAARVAQAHGISVDSIMHGAVGGGEPLDSAYIGERLFVFGESSMEELIRLGNDPRMLRLSGAPFLDHRPRQTARVHPTVRSKAKLKPESPFVLLATSGPGHCTSAEHLRLLVEAVMRISSNRAETCFIATLHQKDRRSFYDEMRTKIPRSRLHVFEHGSLDLHMFDWLQGCRALLTTTSFAALEAMIMEVPVITMDFMGEFRGVDFIDAGATLHARNEQELFDAITRVLERPDELQRLKARAARFIEQAFYRLDGNSGRRCADAIAEQLICAESRG